MVMDAKAETGLNGHARKVNFTSANVAFNTLSGLEVADYSNTCESFRLLLSDDESLPYTLGNGSVSETLADKVALMVSVEDTGIGIPVNAQERVFTPFMQADSSTSRNYGGTGIGLSISKCLVELMGGKINFCSRPDIGSTFIFTAFFQRCRKGAGADRKRSVSEVLPTCFRGMRATLVDRHPVRSAVTKYHLRRLGIIAAGVSTINEALSVLSGQNGYSNSSHPGKQPSILLIEKDSWDPKIDFRIQNDLLKWKEASRTNDVPKIVLLLTAETDKTRIGLHVDAVVMKPLRASTIVTCLQQTLGMGKVQNKDMHNGSNFLQRLLDGKNILVVDDNKVNLRVAAAALKKYGAKVECVESGKSALSLLQPPHKFDACFMDIQMPEMDGFQATQEIRKLEGMASEEASIEEGSTKAKWRVPILAMTADVIQATYEQCVKCGMDGYVSKPFEEAQLYQAVAKFLVSQPISGS